MAAFMVLIWLAASCFAQTVAGTEGVGLPDNASYDGDKFENVQLNNGNLHIEIPLWSSGGRGIPVGEKLVFDSKGFGFYTLCTPVRDGKICHNYLRYNGGGWRIVGPIDYGIGSERVESRNCGTDQDPSFGEIWGNFVIYEPDGTRHHVPGSVSPNPLCLHYTEKIYYASDNSGWMLDADAIHGFKAYRKDGFKIDKSGQAPYLEDTNGNELTRLSGTSLPLPYVDTLGITHQDNGSYYDSTGTLQQIQFTYQTVTVDTTALAKLCACVNGTVNTNAKLLQSVIFPNGDTYTIDYGNNTDGNPASITVPDGGKISWLYQPGDVGGNMVASRTITVNGQSSAWTYAPGKATPLGYGGSNWISKVTDPNLNDTVVTCGSDSSFFQSCHIAQLQYFSGSSVSGNLIKTEVTDYMPVPNSPYYNLMWDFPIRHTTTWNQTNQVTKTETDWDITDNNFQGEGPPIPVGRGVPLEVREYDYGTGSPGPLLRRTHYAYLHSPTHQYDNTVYDHLGIHDRPRDVIVYDGNSNMVSYTNYAYDYYNLQPFPGMGSSGAVQHDPNRSTSYTTRGNPTGTFRWRNTDGAWIQTLTQYDDAGNVIAVQDANGNITQFDYTDSWATGPGGTACATPLGPTKAFLTKTTNALGQSTTATHFSCTGQQSTTTDANQNSVSFSYDLMNRMLLTSYPDGGQVSKCYTDVGGATCQKSAPPLQVVTSKVISSSQTEVSTTVFDGLRRVAQTQVNSDPDGTVYLDTTYDGFGRVQSVSNPHRSALSPTDGMTQNQYDALGRLTKVTKADNSFTTTDYSQFPAITVTDETGKQRRSQSDALGRLITVWEPDANGNLSFETDYQYDANGNLLQANQQGGTSDSTQWRTRTFTFDSLSRLTTATNPESGTISYSYDGNGNLTAKTSPAPNQKGTATITTNYGYDPLSRLTSRSFSDGSHGDGYIYDQSSIWGVTVQNPIGRLVGSYEAVTGVSGSVGSVMSYDAMGRVIYENHFNGHAHTWLNQVFNYNYNLDGSLQYLIYPSGRRIDYGYNNAQQPILVQDAADGINYYSNAHYTPFGAVSTMAYGATSAFAGITWTNNYNTRLQPTLLSAASSQTILGLGYDYNSCNPNGGNNGKICQIVNRRDNSRNQTFTYDPLNRLLSATSANWSESFVYDPWANMLQKNITGSVAPPELPVNLTVAANNQVTNWCYDAGGNVLSAFACPRQDNTYDAENRLSKTVVAGVTTSYDYNAAGERVGKTNADGSLGTLYWYGTGGSVLEETDLDGNMNAEYVFVAGKRIARVDFPNPCQIILPVHYYFADHLGSADGITNADGSIIEAESEFYPYGGENLITDQGIDNRYKFTGKERDPETGLDYFGARYYGSSIGRFMTPDWAAKPVTVPYAKFGDPQSLNLYTYVENSPIDGIDADGHFRPDLDSMAHHCIFCVPPSTRDANLRCIGCSPPPIYPDNRHNVLAAGPPSPDASQMVYHGVDVVIIHRQETTRYDLGPSGNTLIRTKDTEVFISAKPGEVPKFLKASFSFEWSEEDANGRTIPGSTEFWDPHALDYRQAVQAVGTGAMQDAIDVAAGGIMNHVSPTWGDLGRGIAVAALLVDPPTTLLGAGLAASWAGADFGHETWEAWHGR
jgi:RHS repeat-associated protein